MKRILTIQDISCVGKCSLTAALPILSAMGFETVILPTAVLSSHSAFSDYTFCDLTAQMMPITEQWKAEGITFDAIYTGYLGSVKQVSIVQEIIKQFHREDTCVFVDPVLGDFGHLYHGFSRDFPLHMKRLCMGADVIVPNMTEAACLLGIPYLENGYDAAVIEDMLRRLSALGARKVVITGVSFRENEVGFMGYDAAENRFFSHFHSRFEGTFHGTGDVFASTCVGALLRDASLEEAVSLAADFTLESIRQTASADDRRWYGIHYESAFPYLMERLQNRQD